MRRASADARRVEAVGAAVLLGSAVAAQLDRRHAEREQPPGLVAQGVGEGCCGRAREVGLDDRDLAAGCEARTSAAGNGTTVER